MDERPNRESGRMKGGGEIPGGGNHGAGSEAVAICPPGTSACIRFGFT